MPAKQVLPQQTIPFVVNDFVSIAEYKNVTLK
jgi:hypothetical protein